ncbi:hypothetical protein [Comamonas sp. JUb58]|uniref:hypothetical protein n=1 Tax=Comamonas sp. JUb58 TaxID=2485114 RepID=UPI00106070CA|nr:hypothetical protein [Comamonas sp. JUb58]
MIWQIIKSLFTSSKPNDMEIYGMFYSLSVTFIIFWIFAKLIAHIINSTSGIDKRQEIDDNFNREIKRQQRIYDHKQRLLKQEKLKNIDRYKGD